MPGNIELKSFLRISDKFKVISPDVLMHREIETGNLL
jgi:hypothetical protein